jgi:hypothetical protein
VVLNCTTSRSANVSAHHVGLSRVPRDQLVVCGDPDFIREVGGLGLARRLNLPPT